MNRLNKVSADGSKKRHAASCNHTLIAGAAVLAAALTLAVLLHSTGEAERLSPAQDGKGAVFKDDRTLGNPKAPVTLIEYAAPTCSHCAHFMLAEMPRIKKEFIDTGKVFFVFRVFPLQAADGAVEGIARCLPSRRYFPYLEMMSRNFHKWYGPQTPDVREAIVQLATLEGVNRNRADRCMFDPRQSERINRVARDAERSYHVDHTPFFVINGQVVDVRPGQNPGDAVRIGIRSLLVKAGNANLHP